MIKQIITAILCILMGIGIAGCAPQSEPVQTAQAQESVAISTATPTPVPAATPTPEPAPTLVPQPAVEQSPEPTPEKPLSGIVIGVDPGHQAKGNPDKEACAPGDAEMKAKVSSGADGRNTGTPEYKITLAVGLMLRDLLEENGAQVVMTRESSDVDISNKERATMMNDAGADLVVRLHCDGVDDESVHGALMLVPTGSHAQGFEEESLAAGKAILNAFVDQTGAKNRGIMERDDQTGFNWSTVPVCNMEMGCLSNAKEEELLISSDYQNECARGILNGILNYFG